MQSVSLVYVDGEVIGETTNHVHVWVYINGQKKCELCECTEPYKSEHV